MSRFTLGLLVLGLSLATAQAQEAPADPVASTNLPANTIAARDGVSLTFDDIDARMRKIPAKDRAGFINEPDRIEKLLQDMLLMKQLAAQARKSGLADDPVTQAELQLAVDEILARRRVQKMQAELPNVDHELIAKERYDVNPEAFRTAESLDVRHFVIRRETHGDAEARRIAEALRAEFVSKGGDFAEFTKKHSEEPNVETHGGLVSGMVKGQVVTDFETAAFELKKAGELSPVVKTKFGYHVIQLLSRTESKQLPFEKVKAGIIQSLQVEYLKRETQMFLDRLKALPLQANPDNVLALRSRYLPGGEGRVRLGDEPDTEVPETQPQAAAAANKPR